MPIVISGLAAAGAVNPLPAIRNAVTLDRVSHVKLAVGPWYALFAPLYDVWDAFSLFTALQHFAVVALVAAAVIIWRCSVAARRRAINRRREFAIAASAVGLLLAWYGAGALVPRPMVSLVVDDSDAVVVDFHSHTDASHDGRPGFSAERNREWHRSAGFDVAYISDHGTYAAVQRALAGNPSRAGDGTVLLPAFETRYDGQHVNVLGFAAESLYGSRHGLESLSGAPPPRSVLTIPATLEHAGSADRLLAVELVDGSPRGLQFGEDRRSELVRLSARLGAVPVAGSNNHGWGRTAAGWTVLRIPGWRHLTPNALDSAILTTLASQTPGCVTVVERAAPASPNESLRMASFVAIARNPFRTMALAEQAAWIVWAWIPWLVVRLVRKAPR